MIEELTNAEAELLERVDIVSGTMEEKTAYLHQSGVFRKYVQIHLQYVRLIGDPSCGLEALKRALFIQWIATSEPACFTGISDVDAEAEAIVFRKLEACMGKAQLDAELRFMLPWYYRVSEWYFDERDEIPRVKAFIMAGAHEPPQFRRADFDGRGQMARYWQSVTLGAVKQQHGGYADKPRPS